jgi:hypothetical protein
MLPSLTITARHFQGNSSAAQLVFVTGLDSGRGVLRSNGSLCVLVAQANLLAGQPCCLIRLSVADLRLAQRLNPTTQLTKAIWCDQGVELHAILLQEDRATSSSPELSGHPPRSCQDKKSEVAGQASCDMVGSSLDLLRS